MAQTVQPCRRIRSSLTLVWSSHHQLSKVYEKTQQGEYLVRVVMLLMKIIRVASGHHEKASKWYTNSTKSQQDMLRKTPFIVCQRKQLSHSRSAHCTTSKMSIVHVLLQKCKLHRLCCAMTGPYHRAFENEFAKGSSKRFQTQL